MTQHHWSLILAALLSAAGPVAAQPAPPAREAGADSAGRLAAASPLPRSAALVRARRDLVRARQAVRRLDLQARGGVNEVTELFSRTVRLPRNGTFDLQHVSGDVVVTGGGGDTIRIDAVTRVRARAADQAQALLDEVAIDVMERGDRVEVSAQSPRRRGWPGVVDITVTVPSGANVALQSASGRLRVSRVDGELRLQTVSGDITASEVRGLRRIETVSGQIDIRNASGQDVTGGTVSGTLSIDGLETRGVELRSVSGDVRLRDVDAERVLIRSVNGDIEYDGRLAEHGLYELRSHSGDVRVTPAGGAGFQLDAATFSGDVRADVELAVTGVGGPRRGRGARAPGEAPAAARRLRGTASGGGGLLRLRSFSGDIVVAR